ncbi:MAG: SDR family oxidoreductase, partial [Clostridia bacterium]|nr:SDR family oxidoreductase [Clostridia bacterium]
MLVLVTGAGTGIGRACALEFAKQDADLVLLCNKSVGSANEVANQICSMGRSAKVFCVDLRDASSVISTANEILNTLGAPDVIVNNAGSWHGGVIQDMTAEEIDDILGVNVKGMINICKAFAPAMIERHSGCIINITSMWGQTGASCESVYSDEELEEIYHEA